MGHFHYFVSNMIWQWPSVDENSTELVHSTLTQRRRDCVKTFRAKKEKKEESLNKGNNISDKIVTLSNINFNYAIIYGITR